MNDTFTRSFSPDLEIRSAAKGGDGRTIEGIAVPFGTPQRINAQLVEQFARGAFDHQHRAAHRIKLSREHLDLGGSLIGKAVELRNDSKGLWTALRVSATPLGDETLELVRDGALTDLSVGFRERQNRRLQGGVIERVTADLYEIAVTLQGAYGDGAEVLAVRTEESVTNIEKARQILAGLPTLPVVA